MPPRVVTILFTDIVGSVKMYTKVSDSVAVDVVKKLERQVQDTLPPHGGKFIKSTGDGHLCIFEEPAGGARTARTIHGLCDNLAREHKQDLAVRIAVHTGEAVEEGGDIHGQAVNLTARILSVTGACETCVTSDTWSKLSPADRQGFVPHGPEVFKGFSRFAYIYKKPNPNPLTDVTIRPESMAEDDSTLLATDTMPKHSRYALLIEHPQVTRTVVLSEGDTHVLGRAPECHTQIPDRMFSSSHAAFAVVEGILWCFDLQSSNGVVYRGRRLKRRKPIETNSMVQLPTGLVQIKLPS